MPTVIDEATDIQQRYYAASAAVYEDMHLHEGSGDVVANRYVHFLLKMVNAQSVLDVGTATGRALHDVRAILPDAFVCGIEPVAALLGVARRNDVLRSGSLVRGTGLALPFADKSFDVVCEFGVLHHVRDPELMVEEMLRVARKAVIIADCNRFGQGPMLLRLLKLAMYKTRLWPLFDWVRTRGKGYRLTDGDGVSYSYSVYDSFDLLANWADRLIMLPSGHGRANSWCHPLLTSAGVMAFAIKEND